MHLPGGDALAIRSPHALQKRRVQNGAQGRCARHTRVHRGRGRGHAVALDVPVSAGGVRSVQDRRARAGGVGGQDGGGAGVGGAGFDRRRPSRGPAPVGINLRELCN